MNEMLPTEEWTAKLALDLFGHEGMEWAARRLGEPESVLHGIAERWQEKSPKSTVDKHILVLVLRYWYGMTLMAIGLELGLSTGRIQQMNVKMLRILRRERDLLTGKRLVRVG